MKKFFIILLFLYVIGCSGNIAKKSCNTLKDATKHINKFYSKVENINKIDPNIVNTNDLLTIKNINDFIRELSDTICAMDIKL